MLGVAMAMVGMAMVGMVVGLCMVVVMDVGIGGFKDARSGLLGERRRMELTVRGYGPLVL